ncbi:uncharacterized protein [Nicotiana tomentosiformis]|uniref:uncharacterized protein n=1 Tax=Nicotiana tomentosiformis TaxID=4098 RepID=UPI00051AEDCD|nr:uncharacterized protein LOC117273641 [Nicotiana tomentosiformis]
MNATEIEVVELASYHPNEVVYTWYELWEESHEEGDPSTNESEFTKAFIDHFFPVKTRVVRTAKFENLKEGNPSVWDYQLKFVDLSRYALYMFPTIEARVCRFVRDLSPLVIHEATTADLNSDMNYEKMVAFAQVTETRKLRSMMERDNTKKAPSASNFSGSFSGGGGKIFFRRGSSGPPQSIAQTSASTPPSRLSQQ